MNPDSSGTPTGCIATSISVESPQTTDTNIPGRAPDYDGQAHDADLLREHVVRHNDGVRTGDFARMVELFTDDAVFDFVDLAHGRYAGRTAISRVFAEAGPDDELVVLDVTTDRGDVCARYGWLTEPPVSAGTMRLFAQEGQISRLVVSFRPEGQNRA